MQITIEIGTEEQKALILQEMTIIRNVIKELNADINKPIKIAGILVPEDFCKKVNELQGTLDYQSNRGQIAIAKNVVTKEGSYLVFSKGIFIESEDIQTRMQTYLHELMHAFTKELFPNIHKASPADTEYFQNLYILFDEYMANRKSLKILDEIFPEKSKLFKERIKGQVEGFSKDVINCQYYKKIKDEIEKFRTHGDILTFLNNTRNYFDEVSKALVYFYSIIHHYQEYSRHEPFLCESNFVNENAIFFINYLKNKYDNFEVDLSDGLDHIKNYMMNFGVEFFDNNNMLYCHVHNI